MNVDETETLRRLSYTPGDTLDADEAKTLTKKGLIKPRRNGWALTGKGKRQLRDADRQQNKQRVEMNAWLRDQGIRHRPTDTLDDLINTFKGIGGHQ